MIKKVCASFWKLVVLLKTGIKAKDIHRALKFNQSQWLKPYFEFNTKKKGSRKENDKGRKALYKLINNVYGKTMENLRNRINLKPVKNKKDNLSIYQNSRPSYVSQTYIKT